jgi:RNA polymerase sigma factor (sigma-70 family)
LINEFEVTNGINAAPGPFRATYRRAELDDLRQTGLLAILIAERSGAEVTPAYVRIRGGGAIMNDVKKESLRRKRYVSSEELEEQAPGSLGKKVSRDNIDRDIRLGQMGDILKEAMKSLSERERKVLNFRYVQGLDGLDLATELGTDQPYASRIHTRALKKLREFLSVRGVNGLADVI